AAVFAFKLTKEMFGRAAAFWMLLLTSTLPFFFGIAIILTPDAPLTACWAGALLYLYRALIKGRSRAWLGVGICVGLGMLSKYTVALLGPAALVYMLLDGDARNWLKRPQPYLAVIISLALFSPVIYWNSQHEWVSFLFQSSRRLNETSHFSLHLLLGSALFLLTPTGLIAAIVAMFRFPKSADVESGPDDRTLSRLRLFALTFTLVPLAVFVLFSLTHEPKLNWTGPAWLAILPAVAWLISRRPRKGHPESILPKCWMPTIAIMTVLYALALNYLTPGLPGIGYPESMKDIAGYRELGEQVGQIVEQTTESTGRQPLVLGADLYSIASELAFYNKRTGPANTTALHLFGGRSLMYKYWLDPNSADGRDIVMVGKDAGQLMQTGMAEHFESMSATWQIPVSLNGHGIGNFSVRIGYGYHARP
ncbi:MAG TPA: glycosyltransferase family 39 protein, partial [Candidatus Acidoferrum sp.]|nr:glycosyltransferase family 39 protein [Candidatus Acidoferrum sp.]